MASPRMPGRTRASMCGVPGTSSPIRLFIRGRNRGFGDTHPTEDCAMTKRVDPETVLQKEHVARQVQRSGAFLLTIVLAAAVMAAAVVPQLVLRQFYPPITVVAGVIAAYLLLSMRIA